MLSRVLFRVGLSVPPREEPTRIYAAPPEDMTPKLATLGRHSPKKIPTRWIPPPKHPHKNEKSPQRTPKMAPAEGQSP